ncbi:MAG: S8 family peptidase [bacterium]
MRLLQKIIVPAIVLLLVSACASGGGTASPVIFTQPATKPAAGTKPSDWQTSEYYKQHGLAGINAATAYARLTAQGKPAGGAGVKIAIVDSGIDDSHSDLMGSVTYRSLIDDRTPLINNHGTHIAGIVGARRNDGNANNIHGVAFDADLIDIKVSFGGGSSGTDIFFESQAVAAGIASAAGVSAQYTGSRQFTSDPNAEADIINISIGGGSAASTLAIRSAMQLAAARDKIMVLSAGNGGHAQPTYPALYAIDEAIRGLAIVVVSAEQQNDGSWKITDGSNRCGATYEYCIMAPGDQIFSTLTGNTYGRYSGTSMAAPHVSGAVAVIMAAFPGVSPQEIVSRILSSGSNAASGPNSVDGWGLLDLDKAITAHGQLRLAQGRTINQLGPAFNGQVALPSILSGSLSHSLPLQNVLLLDDMNFPFWVDVTQANLQRRSDQFFSNHLYQLHNGNNHSVNTVPLYEGAKYTLLAEQYARPAPGQGLRFQDHFLQAGNNAQGISFVMPIADNWKMTVTQSMASAERGRNQLARAYEQSQTLAPSAPATFNIANNIAKSASFNVAVSKEIQAGNSVAVNIGVAAEQGQLFGEQTGLLHSPNAGGQTAFAEIHSVQAISDRTKLTVQAALAKVDYTGQSLIADGEAWMDSYRVTVQHDNLFSEKDQFRLSVEKPVSAFAGRGFATSPIARTQSGDIIYSDDKLSFTRELPIHIMADYKAEINNTLSYSVNGAAIHQRGQDSVAGFISLHGKF